MSEITDFTQLQKAVDDADREIHSLEARRVDLAADLQKVYVELNVSSMEEARAKVFAVKEKMRVAEEQIREEAKRLGLLSA